MRPADIVDGVPTEAEIAVTVRGMKGGKAGGLLGMCAEDLKGWLKEATRKNDLAR